MTTFQALGLAEPLCRALDEAGYTTPTPIQAGAIPVQLQGRDLVGIAQTGTGKTAAFTLPLLHRLAGRKGRAAPGTVRALILVPTRELAAQVRESLATYGRHLRLTSATVVGGVKPGPQVKALARGLDILVATPGRLEDHLRGGAVTLDATDTVVLDEADQMMDLGFMPAIRRLMAKLPKSRQTVLLSATMPAPIRKLANEFLTEPEEVSVTPQARPVAAIAQSVHHVDAAGKRGVLIDLLRGRDVERAIVFTRTKRGADRVSKHLDQAGLSSAALHGNKSQAQRTRALEAFRDGRVGILVATDIAARGIDIDDISHVVNYELPNVPEAYVHRIGRTARAGKDGIAISLCDPEERKLLRDIEKLIGAKLAAAGGNPHAPLLGDEPEAPSRPARSGRPRGQGPHRSGNRQGHPASERPTKSARANPGERNRHGERMPSDEAHDAGLTRMLGGTPAAHGGPKKSGRPPRRRRQGRSADAVVRA